MVLKNRLSVFIVFVFSLFSLQNISAQIKGIHNFPVEDSKRKAAATFLSNKEQAVEICNNNIDDDNDGLTDCEDNDCYFTEANCKCKEINVLWATDNNFKLLWFNVQTGIEHFVGTSPIYFTDITWAPNGKLYGSASNNLYEINPSDGSIVETFYGVLGSNAGLTAHNNGLFYYDTGNNIYSYNLTTDERTQIGTFDNQYFVSGDLAFKDGILLGSVFQNSTQDPYLLKMNLSTGTSTVVKINNTPSGVFLLGLVNSANGIVYASGDKVTYSIDVNTGDATEIFTSTIAQGYAGMTNISAICQTYDSCTIAASIVEKDFCSGADTLKAIVNSIKPYELTWYLPNGDSIKNIQHVLAAQSGLYTIKAKITNCTSSTRDTFTLRYKSIPSFSLGNDTNYCQSFSRVLTTGVPNTIWNTGEIAPSITVTTLGKYWATAETGCGKISDTIKISNKISKLNLGNDTSYCLYNFDLKVDNPDFIHFLWQNGDTSSAITVNSPDIYSVKATSKNSCTYSDTINIIDNCDYFVFLTNVFSPNNDGVNDLFKPLNVINQIEYISFKIFDRWNELVFEGSAENNFSWDGFYKNKEAQVDSYVWILEYKILNNKRSKKGIVSLLR